MKINIKAIIAVIVAILILVWTVSSVQQQSYSGAQIEFPLGTGTVVVNNPNDTAAEARLSATGSRGNFTVNSSALDAPVAATREGSGRNMVYNATLELPPGITEVNLTRGSGVTMAITGANPIDVTVNPLSESEQSSTLLVGILVAVTALAYAAFSTRQTWLGLLRNRGGSAQTAGTSGEATSAS